MMRLPSRRIGRVHFFWLLALAAAVLLTGCGLAANRKPIPSGTPTASMHFGPVRGGFLSQSFNVHDGEYCHPAQFARYHTIGSYLGSDLDVDVPADRTLYLQMGNAENHGCSAGLCTTRCSGGASFKVNADAKYRAQLVYEGNACAILVSEVQSGKEIPLPTRPETQRCLY
jgi:hypothetical protein